MLKSVLIGSLEIWLVVLKADITIGRLRMMQSRLDKLSIYSPILARHCMQYQVQCKTGVKNP